MSVALFENIFFHSEEMAFFTELEQNFYNLYGNKKDPEYPKQSWEKKQKQNQNRAGVFRLCDFRLYYKATVIKTIWYRQKTETEVSVTG